MINWFKKFFAGLSINELQEVPEPNNVFTMPLAEMPQTPEPAPAAEPAAEPAPEPAKKTRARKAPAADKPAKDVKPAKAAKAVKPAKAAKAVPAEPVVGKNQRKPRKNSDQ